MSLPIAPNSGYAESYINPEKKIRFLPISKAGLDHKNPRTWDDYPVLDEYTRMSMAAIMTPKVYMHLHYSKHTFGQLTESVHASDVDYLIMDGRGAVRSGVSREEKQTCRLLDYGAKQVIGRFVTVVNANILSGDLGKLSNLSGARFMFKNRDDDYRKIEGFIPYFLFPFEDKDGHVSQIYVHFTNKLTVLQCNDSQHDNALQHIKATCALKRFNKMCAWCGKLRGDGKHDKLLKCTCKSCRYCSKDCQTRHWPCHREICKEAIAALAT
jgi:hypothetical protein